MVNTEKLSGYLKKAGQTWEAIVDNCGGLPATLQEFAETFDEHAKAEDVVLIAGEANIPACQIGLVFFAPEEQDDGEKPQLAELNDSGDLLMETFERLNAKSQEQLLSTASELLKVEV